MSNVQLGSERTPHDLSHFVFSTGRMGCLKVLSHTHVLAGDSIEIDALGAFRLSPLRRGLAVDSKVEIFSFYVPYRYNYGNDIWNDFLQKGIDSAPLDGTAGSAWSAFASALGLSKGGSSFPNPIVPFPLADSYVKIWNRYFRVPTEAKVTGSSVSQLGDAFSNDKNYEAGFNCAHMKTIWSAPLNDATRLTDQYEGAGLDLMALNKQYADLHTQQEREHFMTYYADVVESFGGKASRDSEQRPHLLMHTEFWASGYDVDGTSETSLGQFSGRVQQSWKHEVPRFFCPEHGQVITLALSRFPPTMMGETDYLDVLHSKASTYADIAGDSAIVANQPPQVLLTNNFIPGQYSESTFRLPHSQWFRYQRSHVDSRYFDLEGFPFIDHRSLPSGTNQRYVHPNTYDKVFQTEQLNQWNMQCKFNVNVLRDLPVARDSIMTS